VRSSANDRCQVVLQCRAAGGDEGEASGETHPDKTDSFLRRKIPAPDIHRRRLRSCPSRSASADTARKSGSGALEHLAPAAEDATRQGRESWLVHAAAMDAGMTTSAGAERAEVR
jgi:hypothetical protein